MSSRLRGPETDEEFYFNRKNFGFSRLQAKRAQNADFIIKDLNENKKTPQQIVENRRFLVEREKKSLDRITTVLQTLSCVQHISYREILSHDDSLQGDLRIKLKSRKVREVFIKLITTPDHAKRFLKRKSVSPANQVLIEGAKVMSKDQLILLSSSLSDEMVITAFLNGLQEIEHYLQRISSSEVINIQGNGSTTNGDSISIEPFVRQQSEVAIELSAQRLRESIVVEYVKVIEGFRPDGAELTVGLITGEKVDIKLVSSEEEALRYVTKLAHYLKISLSHLFFLFNQSKLLVVVNGDDQNVIKNVERELVRLWDENAKDNYRNISK